MSVVINTNVDAIKIQNLLAGSTNKMSQSMQRMSSGLKINSAKDDAAGAVIAAKMSVQLTGNKVAQNNVQNANALLSTAEGNLDVVQDNVSRIRDLTLQAKNGTYSTSELQAMQDEVDQRIAEIDRISNSAEYSSLKLFDQAGSLDENGITFQVGANAGDNNTITASGDLFKSVQFSSLTGAHGFNLIEIGGGEVAGHPGVTYEDDVTGTKYDQAINALDKAVDNITSRKSIIGSAGNRLDSALDTLATQFENLTSAKSIITDADVAAEASKFTQQSILQQVSTSLLAQANQAPSIALSLI